MLHRSGGIRSEISSRLHVIKPFTSMAVMQLVKFGKVGLDDRLSRYVSDSSPSGAENTPSELVSPTSGLLDGGWVGCDGPPLLTITTKEHLRQISGDALPPCPSAGAFSSDGG